MVVTRVVLDVDTGVDDALALLLAARHPALELLAVTCVAGNAAVDQVVANTLTVLDAAGAGDVPVARGADRPLLGPAREPRHVHGQDGMGDLGLPASGRRADPRHAVELLRDTLLGAPEPVTLVTLAPTTNVALLLRTYPAAAERLERIVLMGGSAGPGNATPAAEFNVWHDPEAAAVVLGCGRPVTMYGLDVFHEVTVDRATATGLAGTPGAGGEAARLAGRLIGHQVDRFGTDAATIGDAGAVAAVIDPDGLRTSRHEVRVELSGSLTRGQTVVDRRPAATRGPATPGGAPPPLVDVGLAVAAERYRKLFLEAVR